MKMFLVAAVCAFVAACSGGEKAEAPAKTGASQTIRFATDWRAQAEQGGFYQALATGEYAKRGLEVKIIQGGPAVNVPQLLAAGAVEMGIGSNSFIPLNMAREGVPVRAVAASMQKDPQVLIAHPGQGVARIADMKGRPILLSDASRSGWWLWLKARYGFSDDQVRPYSSSTATFLANKAAVQQGYATSEPYTIEKEAGVKPQVFLLADEGYPGYAAMILATDKLIAENPQAVKAFVEATAAGWKSYLTGDPAPGDALIRKDHPEMTQDLLDQAREKIRSYGLVESGDAATLGIGAMTDARWETFFKMAAQHGIYPADLDYKKAYTLQFLGK